MTEQSDFPWSGLEETVEITLQQARVHDVGAYGWLNEDEVDPKYTGHAMWQQSQPYLELGALMGDHPVRRRPEVVDGEVLTLGEDFCGLMKASRLSIGLALVWKVKEISNLLSESAFFWLHHMDAYLKLDIAADRLRALVIMACTGKTTDQYKLLGRKNRLYVTPFKELTSLLLSRGVRTDNLQATIENLPEMASRIQEFRDRRNAIVHEVATRTGMTTRDSVRQLQQQFDDEQIHGITKPQFDYSELQKTFIAHDERRIKEIDGAIDTLIASYRLLIDASNEVFQVEYAVRATAGSTA